MRRLLALALVVAAALVAAACGGDQGSARATSPAPADVRPAAGAADWPTYHRDNSRDGDAPEGPVPERARRLWSAGVDGDVYAEPLVAAGEVVVATENDTLYAFDTAGHRRWRAHLGAPVPGGALPCGNIDPSGITGTPVIDPGRRLVYSVVFRRPGRHELVAVDLTSGRVRWRRRIDPPGADPRVHQQRAALALSRGRIYVAYGGLFGDCGDYHGWVVGAPAGGPGGRLISYRVPAHREAGIWGASGPAIDGAGNVYVSTGNGDSSSFDFGDAVIRLSPRLRRTGYFAPRDSGALNTSDTDLGSMGPVLLPGGRVFIAGKSSIAYLLNGGRLGGIGHSLATLGIGSPGFGGAAYAGGTVFVPATSRVVAVRVAGGGLARGWTGPGFHPGAPIVAAGAVWVIDLDGGDLYALDAGSGRVRMRTSIGDAAQFSTPAASGGRVYVAAGGRLIAFG